MSGHRSVPRLNRPSGKQRNAIGLQQLMNPGAMLLNFYVEPVEKDGVSSPYAHRNGESEGDVRIWGNYINRRHLQRYRAMFGKVSGHRTPGNGDIHSFIGNGADEVGGRVLLIEIAVNAIANDVPNDSPPNQRVHRRQIVFLISGDVDSNPKLMKPRVIHGFD